MHTLNPKVYKISGLGRQDTGVSYYRINQPIYHMMKEGYIEEGRILPFSGENKPTRIGLGETPSGAPSWNDKLLMKLGENADILWSTCIWDLDEIVKILDLRKWSGAKWVVDMDDNLYAVTQDNPAYADSKTFRQNFETCIAVADGITTSVPMLADLYRNLNPNVFVQKNCIDLNDWKHKPTKHEKLRIGWRGAYGHQLDIALAMPALRKLRQKYDFDLVAFGVEPEDKSLEWIWHKWVGFLKYPKKLASLGYDIAIIPLADSSYNRCKSNVAWLEYSSLKIPTVYSPTENQKGLPGFEADSNYEWYEALEKLILDAKLRQEIGQQGYDYMKKHYLMKNNLDDLVDWFAKLERRTDIEPTKLK